MPQGVQGSMNICPDCGARSDEFRSAMFSGSEPAVRDHGMWLECKKCGKTWDKSS